MNIYYTRFYIFTSNLPNSWPLFFFPRPVPGSLLHSTATSVGPICENVLLKVLSLPALEKEGAPRDKHLHPERLTAKEKPPPARNSK